MWWVCNTFHTNSTQKTHTKNKETIFNLIEQLPSWLRWLRICLQGGRPGFDPWVGRSSGEENSNPLQYSCLEFHGQRSLVAYNPWGCKESDMTEWLTHTSWKVQQYQLQDLCCYTGFWTSWARNKENEIKGTAHSMRELCVLSRFSHVWLFETPWTVAQWTPRSWDSPGKNTGAGCMPSWRGWNPSLVSPALAGGFFTTSMTYTVKCTKAQQLVEGAHAWQCAPDTWTDSRDWTREHVCIF